MTQAQGAAPQPEDAGKADSAGGGPPESTEPDPAGAAPESAAPEPPAQDDLKAKYREALAHKQGSHGAAEGGHGDRGAAPHGTNTGPGQRMFRRKSG